MTAIIVSLAIGAAVAGLTALTYGLCRAAARPAPAIDYDDPDYRARRGLPDAEEAAA